jgi:predicted TIM-barrel fold metal-dependent hydrolase
MADTARKRPRVIAIEEHYSDPAFHNTLGRLGALAERLKDMEGVRIRDMDAAGIDVQVLSHTGPGTQYMDPSQAIELAPKINDRLYEAVQRHPTRFAAFAMLPTPDPKAAAAELERCVTKMGFKGAMVHGLTHGQFLDDEKFWPIFERAQALDVPIYLHPAEPHPKVIEIYYKDHLKKFPNLITAPLGYTVETMVAGVRMVVSGVFEKFPKLKFILGHMGEGIPFLLWRIDHTLKSGPTPIEFRELFCRHFWITTSGFFSDPAMLCSIQEMGADRVIFSIDWPWGNNKQGVDWMDHISLSAEDKAKIFSGNVEKLLKMG